MMFLSPIFIHRSIQSAHTHQNNLSQMCQIMLRQKSEMCVFIGGGPAPAGLFFSFFPATPFYDLLQFTLALLHLHHRRRVLINLSAKTHLIKHGNCLPGLCTSNNVAHHIFHSFFAICPSSSSHSANPFVRLLRPIQKRIKCDTDGRWQMIKAEKGRQWSGDGRRRRRRRKRNKRQQEENECSQQ